MAPFVAQRRGKRLAGAAADTAGRTTDTPISRTGRSDPAAFLSESVHEIFDEYYSVSLSFWTKMGLREKARQGRLTGSLPWGLTKGEDAVPALDTEKAPFVLRIFELYASGQHTDRTLAEWLNVQGQRTTRGRLFISDTVREMLCNAAYCGYVSGRRDKSKAIKGLHEAIVPEELYDRVQLMRRERARTLKPGRPSPKYVLRGLARCKRCHANMQGTSGGRDLKARYYCATRRATRSCDQPIIPAEQVELQLAQFLTDFTPNKATQTEILHRLANPTAISEDSQTTKRRTRWRSAYVGCATSTNSGTSTAPSTSPGATRSTPS
jgi:Recombinase/Recombinase zinc beta ribbon domain